MRGSVYRTDESCTKMRRSTKGHIARLLEEDSIGDGLLVDGIDVVVRRVSRGALLSMLDIAFRVQSKS